MKNLRKMEFWNSLAQTRSGPRHSKSSGAIKQSRMPQRSIVLSITAIVLLGGFSVAPSQANTSSNRLPSAYEAKLRDSHKSALGQWVNLKVCSKQSGFTCKKYGNLRIKVNGISFAATNGWPDGTPLYNIDVSIENRTTRSTGVLPKLLCANSSSEGSFYIGSAETQSLPAKSQQSGAVISSFPQKALSSKEPSIPAKDCVKAVIWMEPTGGNWQASKSDSKSKNYSSAYIPLPQSLLDSLTAEADAAFAAETLSPN